MLTERKGAGSVSGEGGLFWGIRLRHLLGLALVVGLVQWAWPRSSAAWTLQNQGVSYANYAVCMIGPMGPRLLRDNPELFKLKVRRRIVSAQPTDRPLRGCLELAQEIGVDSSVLRLHSATAESFHEYTNTPAGPGAFSVEQLDTSLARLEALADDAWPFVSGSGADLMNPSTHAKEARYTPEPPRAGRGSGLGTRRSLYRSTAAYGDTVVGSFGSGANAAVLISKDGGVNWIRGGRQLSATVRDKCVAGDEGRAFTVSRTNDGKRIVLSHGGNAAPQVAVLASDATPVAAISCDEEALVAALIGEADQTGRRRIVLRICPFRRPCKDLTPPNTGASPLHYPLDVARISGDTVVATTSGGITRVSSSRDNGASWVPWTVVYDHLVAAEKDAKAPFRLLVVGDRLMLYAGSEVGSYSVLVSEDHGATFRAPRLSESKSTTAPQAEARSDLNL